MTSLGAKLGFECLKKKKTPEAMYSHSFKLQYCFSHSNKSNHYLGVIPELFSPRKALNRLTN